MSKYLNEFKVKVVEYSHHKMIIYKYCQMLRKLEKTKKIYIK